MNDRIMTDAKNQAVDWAVKYIESGTGYLWFRDAFNAYCEEKATIELNPDNVSFDIEETRRFLEKETWVKRITAKGAKQYESAAGYDFMHGWQTEVFRIRHVFVYLRKQRLASERKLSVSRSRTERAAAQATGFPPKVEPWSP